MSGGVLIAAGGTFLTVLCICYILLIIANWKIFTKAGEAGWKSIIPIYNVYIMYKIVGLSFLTWLILPAVASGILSCIGAEGSTLQLVCSFISGIIMLVVGIVYSNKLAKAFGKGTGFTVGLILLPNIFTLILGFGSSEYDSSVTAE